MGKWKYHVSHSYKSVATGNKTEFQSQLYQIGVYGIINNDPGQQTILTPAAMVTLEKKLRAYEKKKEITDLVFGREITVSDDTGFFEEVK